MLYDKMLENTLKLSQQLQEITQELLEKKPSYYSSTYPSLNEVSSLSTPLVNYYYTHPSEMFEKHYAWAEQLAHLYLKNIEAFALSSNDNTHTHAIDPQFKDSLWEEHPYFKLFKDTYGMTQRWTNELVDTLEYPNEDSKKHFKFLSQQMLDALSPKNFALTNPEVVKATIDSNGENLVKGLDNFLNDIRKNPSSFSISMADEAAFTLGETIATTKGSVVYQNELMQLIQYAPLTKKIYERPLLVIPPWINKYYILDLSPENSLIAWLVKQGYTTFVISWVNPDKKLAHMGFEDYLRLGPLAALETIKKLTQSTDINAIGYCIGGTLLACLLAYLETKKTPDIKAATFLTTLTDFSEPGDIGLFIQKDSLPFFVEHMKENGVFSGHDMAQMFNRLRSRDLIWSFIVNNYLLGKRPLEFDLLYWNADNTNLPEAMHLFYLQHMYIENSLIQPGKVVIHDVPIDLSCIKIPTYFLSTKDDHIAPWESVFNGAVRFKNATFALSGSGHIAGVVNPPSKHKYQFWTSSDPINAFATPQDWLSQASEHVGSWWPHWHAWNKKFSGKSKPIDTLNFALTHAIEPAPGSYVRKKL